MEPNERATSSQCKEMESQRGEAPGPRCRRPGGGAERGLPPRIPDSQACTVLPGPSRGQTSWSGGSESRPRGGASTRPWVQPPSLRKLPPKPQCSCAGARAVSRPKRRLAAAQGGASLRPQQLCHPSWSFTTRSLGFLFCPIRGAWELWGQGPISALFPSVPSTPEPGTVPSTQ